MQVFFLVGFFFWWPKYIFLTFSFVIDVNLWGRFTYEYPKSWPPSTNYKASAVCLLWRYAQCNQISSTSNLIYDNDVENVDIAAWPGRNSKLILCVPSAEVRQIDSSGGVVKSLQFVLLLQLSEGNATRMSCNKVKLLNK